MRTSIKEIEVAVMFLQSIHFNLGLPRKQKMRIYWASPQYQLLSDFAGICTSPFISLSKYFSLPVPFSNVPMMIQQPSAPLPDGAEEDGGGGGVYPTLPVAAARTATQKRPQSQPEENARSGTTGIIGFCDYGTL